MGQCVSLCDTGPSPNSHPWALPLLSERPLLGRGSGLFTQEVGLVTV